MGPTDNQPDFDNMSPEEIMAWMESLAKRQGASEGFTTAADMDVPEIDPNSVVLDEPGYVPYGQEEKAAKPAPAAQKPAQPPVPKAEPRVPAAPPPAPKAEPRVPAAPPPVPKAEPRMPAASVEPPLEAAIGESTLAWLESLAADQGVGDFTIDFSSIEPEPAARPVRSETDPQDWLKGLAAEPELPEALSSEPQPVERVDWLDSVARRPVQTTPPAPADEDLPLFAAAKPEPQSQPESLVLEDPASWLDSLAVEGGFGDQAVRAERAPSAQPVDDFSIEAIERAIREGRVTPEQMRRYQEYSMERAAHEEVVETYEVDLDAPAQPGELPDWLAALKPVEETVIEEPPVDRPPLESLFTDSGEAALPVEGIPDWLQDEGAGEESIENIFAGTEAPAVEIDHDDPWVEAFDQEYQRAAIAEDEVPAWYEQNIHDPVRITRVEQFIGMDTSAEDVVELEPAHPPIMCGAVVEVIQPAALADAALPSEASLPHGERQAVPAWMRTGATQTMPAVPTPSAVETQDENDFEAEPAAEAMPDWLRTDEQIATPVTLWPSSETAVEPPPAVPIPAVSPPAPRAPVTSSTLQEARARYQNGELDTSLAIYEALVRASDSLADVAVDLTRIAEAQPGNAVVHRVLGDSLMRQGRLQEALNTYRAALNSLYRSK